MSAAPDVWDPVEIRACKPNFHGRRPGGQKWWCVRVFRRCVSAQLTESRAKGQATWWRNLLRAYCRQVKP